MPPTTSSPTTEQQKPLTEQVKDNLPTAVVDSYEQLPSFQDLQNTVSDIFNSITGHINDPAATAGTNQNNSSNDELFKGVNMQDFSDWFNKNVKNEKDDKTKYEKIKSWLQEQRDKADKDLQAFKKDMNDLVGRESSTPDEDKDSLANVVNWDALQNWYKKNVKGEEIDKSKYEKLKSWLTEQKDKADKKLDKASDDARRELDAFKKDMDELVDKHSSHSKEDKDQFQIIDWDALKNWYDKNVIGKEEEKSRYEKVKEWMFMNAEAIKKDINNDNNNKNDDNQKQ